MFNFYEFPMQLHFTYREKQKGGNIGARLCVSPARPRLPEWVCRGAKRGTGAQHVIAHSSATRAPAERGPGAREGGRARRRAAAAGGAEAALGGAPSSAPSPGSKRPVKRRVRDRARPRLGEGERGLRRPPRRRRASNFGRLSARKRAGREPKRDTERSPSPSFPREPLPADLRKAASREKKKKKKN